MKAVLSDKYGTPEVLEIKNVGKPVPLDHQVLVRIHASSINFGNMVLLKGKPYLARLAFGLTRPKYPIPGGDIAGVVESVGKNVTQFKQGDEVYGDLSRYGWGGFAEYVAVPEEAITFKPSSLSFEEAAASPMAAITALQGIRDKGHIKEGQHVLLYGASGGVGTFAVQIAKAFGAEVTGVCSTRNIPIVKSLGADKVIDYTKEKFSNNHEQYDLIVGVNGHQSLSTYKKMLKENGTFVHIGGSESQMYQTLMLGPIYSMSGSRKMHNLLQRTNKNDLNFVKDLLETRKMKPVIDRIYPLDQVKEALHYFNEGHAQGKVVLTM
ncbi:NAD(P)-dependent alcohol dehydrogenase [Bacillus sp. BGMRC 2118]|nr:NAD(P)-dependent alcohol dehydrogenase [Bacillus sp. BGMRC 2118]